MSVIETNIYPITNLAELSSSYRLVEIAGLRPDQAEYFQNRQALQRKLSYSLKKPVIVIERDERPFLVVPDDVGVLPTEISLVRAMVQLHPSAETLRLDYGNRGDGDLIALRFLSFLIQAPLWSDSRLWQPAAGRGFFERTPHRTDDGIDQFLGFVVRPLLIPGGGIGLCVDVTTTYVGSQPLPSTISRNEFASYWKKRNCIYRFGSWWYEIQLRALADRSVRDYRFVKNGRTWSLLDYVFDAAKRPLPSDVANLREESAVVLYHDARGNELGAPAALCYPVFQTSDARVARQHRHAILSPSDRRAQTREFVDRFLRRIRFGVSSIHLSQEPLKATARPLQVPDFRFGNNATLSVRSTPRAIAATLQTVGKQKLDLLRNPKVGFFEARPLDRQYLILPSSVFATLGDQFILDLKRVAEEFFPHAGGYSPTIVTYDDRGQRTFARQARALRDAVSAQCSLPGYALVMVHHTTDRREREEDQLAAMAVRELRHQHDIRASVIHSDVPRRCYREERGKDGQVTYRVPPSERGRLNGYLRNVVIAKLLLTNQRWPFVLATPLKAELTIGIDVKNNTAGLLSAGEHGSAIRSELRESRQKEQLLQDQMTSYVLDIVRKEFENRGSAISTIVIHRDGRAWPSEIRGVRGAIKRLNAEGILTSHFQYAVLEVSKSAPAPVRMYSVDSTRKTETSNPVIGALHVVSDKEAYVCTTGAPFLRDGTAHPLHITKVDGSLPFESCIEDLFALSSLTWTQPDGCMRYPITTRLNDRILTAEGTDYDADAIEFLESSDVDADSIEGVA